MFFYAAAWPLQEWWIMPSGPLNELLVYIQQPPFTFLATCKGVTTHEPHRPKPLSSIWKSQKHPRAATLGAQSHSITLPAEAPLVP